MIEKIPTQAVPPAPTDDSSPPSTTSQPVVQSGSDTATLPPNIATKNDIISVEEKQAKFTQELHDLASMLRDIQQKTHTIFQVPFKLFMERIFINSFDSESKT